MKRIQTIAILALTFFMLATSAYAGKRVYVVRKPPPLQIEVIREAPSRDYVWIQGYWVWKDNDFRWVPGHWEKCPHVGVNWVPGYWKHTRHGYYWISGHWK